MRRALQLSTAAFALAAFLATPAVSYEIVTNGGFETGSLTDWQTHTETFGGGAGWFATPMNEAPITGYPLDPPAAGAWQAATDQEAASTVILYRDIAIPATAKATLRLTFWINNLAGFYLDDGTLSALGSNQKVRMDLQNPAVHGLLDQFAILENLYTTDGSTPAHVFSTPLTRDLTAYAGQTVRLRIAVVVALHTLNLGVDEIGVEVSPFLLSHTLDPMHAGDAAWGDFDNDDDLDLVIGGATNDANLNIIYRRQPDGSMYPSGDPLPLITGNAYAWGDMDDDGDLDLAMHGYGVEVESYLFRNDLPAGLTSIGGLPLLFSGAMAWGDFDCDGDLDLLSSGHVGVFNTYCYYSQNEGGGTFTTIGTNIPGTINGSMQVADFDLDGYLDVLVCGLDTYLFGSSAVTAIFRGNGSGGFTYHDSGLPALTGGVARWMDADGDALLDVAIAGDTGGGPIARVYTLDFNTFRYLSFVPLTPVSEAALDCGDFDNDGDTDLALAGHTGTERITRVYRNDSGAFTDINAGLIGVQSGTLRWGDQDGDRDLDLLVAGNTGPAFISRIYRNMTAVPNAAPSAPTQFATTITGNGVWFVFYGDSDDHTYYPGGNLRIGSSPGGVDGVTPMSNPANGYRRIVHTGNTSPARQHFVRFQGLGHGTVRWAAQAVDGSFVGGPFSAELTLVMGASLLSVEDVPNDQGGRVRLRIARAPLDHPAVPQFPVAGYNVWRRVNPGGAAQLAARQAVPAEAEQVPELLRGADGLTLLAGGGRLFARGGGAALDSPFPPGTWELVGSFFAQQQAEYLYNSPTAADSGAGGDNWAAFVITAHSTTPSVWFASEADSGQSVDNIAPGAPQGLVANYHTGNGNTLNWQPAPESDFQNFRVYRGTNPGFTPGPANLIASVPNPSFTDPAYDNATVFYKVSTTDDAGNESPAVAPGQTVAVEGPGLPRVRALHAAVPNPFQASARIGFALPAAERVRLRIYDTAGRLVRTLADQSFAPGEHSVDWRGDDDAGGRVRAGVYFVRFTAGDFQATRRLLRVE